MTNCRGYTRITTRVVRKFSLLGCPLIRPSATFSPREGEGTSVAADGRAGCFVVSFFASTFGGPLPPRWAYIALLLILPGGISSAGEFEIRAVPLGRGQLQLMCPDRFASPKPDLLIHFHGAAEVTQANFRRAGLPGALVTINFNGLSSAYSVPFRQQPQLFRQILQITAKHATELLGNEGPRDWGRVYLSSFSAGYGAVREILKNADDFERITGFLAADSIYASLVKGVEQRTVDPEQMRDFRRFAKLAAEGRKVFVVTHTYLETPYASTFETADDLLAFVGVRRIAATDPATPLLVPRNVAHQRGLQVFGYEGTDGEAHLQHLRQIGGWWPLLYRDPSSTR